MKNRPLSNSETKNKIVMLLGIRGKSIYWLADEIKYRSKWLDPENKRGFLPQNQVGKKGNNLAKQLRSESSKIPAETVSLIAEALDVDVDYLLTDTDEERKKVSDVSAYLGLSEDSVKCILEMKSNYHDDVLGHDLRITGLEALLNDEGSGKLFDILGEQKQLGEIFSANKQFFDTHKKDQSDDLNSRGLLDAVIYHLIKRILDRLRGEN